MAREEEIRPNKRRKRQNITLYDAVAGRAGYEGFLTTPQPSKHRDTPSTSTTAVPPEEVLFRRKGAPVRYEDDDIYFADRHLEPERQQQLTRLPDSELLKVLHAYVSDFCATTEDGGEGDWRSLDETALLALGILVEEAAVEALGETGDLALVEAADEQHNGGKTEVSAEDPRVNKP